MAAALAEYPDIQVDWLFSGRKRKKFFDMELFGDYQCRYGMTFHSKAGRIQPLKTLANIKPLRMWRDKRALDLRGYDLVISDYEPITVRAARYRQMPCIGIGHQYAFCHDVPERGANMVTRAIMQTFAPVTTPIGLHWHHFGQPILPPIVDLAHELKPQGDVENHVLVYLPFEAQPPLLKLFKQFPHLEFHVYAPDLTWSDDGNVHTRPPSRDGFQSDLVNSQWVICNAGFELISEALQLGKQIMAKPLEGQMEQLSNAAALEQLGYATVEDHINYQALDFWFDCELDPVRPHYPDVAAALARWIDAGGTDSVASLSEELWRQTGQQEAPDSASKNSSSKTAAPKAAESKTTGSKKDGLKDVA